MFYINIYEEWLVHVIVLCIYLYILMQLHVSTPLTVTKVNQTVL